MKCQFCPDGGDNSNFNNPAEHLVITISATGHTHIHGPFENVIVIENMARLLIAEMEKHGITYTPSVEHRKGD
jgi:hypothetical protein